MDIPVVLRLVAAWRAVLTLIAATSISVNIVMQPQPLSSERVIRAHPGSV